MSRMVLVIRRILSVQIGFLLMASSQALCQEGATFPTAETVKDIEKRLDIRLSAKDTELLTDNMVRIKRLAAEDLEDAVRRLAEDDDYAGNLQSEVKRSYDCRDPEIVIGSRRYSRIRTLIDSLPQPVRAKAAQTAYDAVLSAFRIGFDCAVRKHKDPRAPNNAQSFEAVRRGFSASLFLAARYGSPGMVQEEIMRLHELWDAVEDRLKAEGLVDKVAWFYRYVLFVTPEVEINAVLMALEQDAKRYGQLRERIVKQLGDRKMTKAVTVCWDSPIVSTDRLFRDRGLPVSGKEEEQIVFEVRLDERKLADKVLQLFSSGLTELADPKAGDKKQ